MTKYIKVFQKFRPVGQGLFYSGSLHSGSEKYNFVYDCGSVSEKQYLKSQIDDHINTCLQIDLLIISHFDEDHVNGITSLIADRKRVRRLVLPYVSWAERLAIATTSGAADEYLALLRDPIGFFSGEAYNVGEIIVVGGPGGSQPDSIPPVPFSPKRTINSETNGGFIDTLIGQIRSISDYFFEMFAPWEMGKKPKFIVYSEHLKILVGSYWEFEFFNTKGADKAKIMAFQSDLKAYMK